VWLAIYLHRIPFSIALGLPLLLGPDPGSPQQQTSLPAKYMRLLQLSGTALLSALAGVLLPAAYSAALLTFTGVHASRTCCMRTVLIACLQCRRHLMPRNKARGI
jgi:hypothetical protein